LKGGSAKNPVAVVTGAGTGIGRAIALGLAEKGAAVVLMGRTKRTLEEVAHSAAKDKTDQTRCFQGDITSEKDLRRLAGTLKRDYGGVDILIHSAGLIHIESFPSASLDNFERQFRTNVLAPYALTQLLLPMLIAREGQVVFINSTAGLNSAANVSQYAATKHALKAMADSLRAEVNAKGVRVLSVYPGRTASPLQEAVHKSEGKVYSPERLLQPEDVADMVLAALALPRTAEVTDLMIRPMMKPT
jgi:NADP-dependent 3-hydroxy acid dehydrogenase YdfG